MTGSYEVEDLLRELTPRVLGALVRHYGHFDEAEEAVQDALLAASRTWPDEGLPRNPRGWLITAASRRLIDQLRSADARRRREQNAVDRTPRDEFTVSALDADQHAVTDDTLQLLFLCCHESLSEPSQLALTLRAVGGLTTAEIARAFLVPETTMAQRISRAKRTVRQAGARFEDPSPQESGQRLDTVLHVLYLIFNEGYTATAGEALVRSDLTNEAIRLTRQVHALLPDDGEVTGLLALMLLTDARRAARSRADGGLVPLAEQDRRLWDQDRIREGVELITAALPRGQVGAYQLQAAIAAVHDEAVTAAATDWPQILTLYDMLSGLAPNPMIMLNRAIAVAMVDGSAAGLDALRSLEGDERLRDHHRLFAVRAHLLQLAGDDEGARTAYAEAARRTTSRTEQDYLLERVARLR